MPPEDMQAYYQFLRRLNQCVAVMHQRGYEDLWALPHVGGAGFYRWTLAPGSEIDERWWPTDHSQALSYSSSAWYEWCDWTDVADDNPEQLADKLIARKPGFVARCRQSNPGYVSWLQTVMARTEPDGLFLLYDGNRYPEPEAPFYWWPEAEWHGDYEYLPPLPPPTRGK